MLTKDSKNSKKNIIKNSQPLFFLPVSLLGKPEDPRKWKPPSTVRKRDHDS